MPPPKAQSTPFPRVLVFDLDGTFWSPEMYQLWGGGGAPFNKHPTRKDALVDRAGTHVELLGDTHNILNSFVDDLSWVQRKTIFAVASTCDEPRWAEECLKKFHVGTKDPKPLQGLFEGFSEIYHASTKAAHMRAILEKAQKMDKTISYKDFVFFDNQMNNVRDVSGMGIVCQFTPEGLTEQHWVAGLELWRKTHFGLSDL